MLASVTRFRPRPRSEVLVSGKTVDLVGSVRSPYSARITGKQKVMQMLQTAAHPREPARTRFAPGDSLRYDLSAPPPASQVFATGVASARQTML